MDERESEREEAPTCNFRHLPSHIDAQLDAVRMFLSELDKRLLSTRSAIRDRGRVFSSVSFKRLLQFGLPEYYSQVGEGSEFDPNATTRTDASIFGDEQKKVEENEEALTECARQRQNATNSGRSAISSLHDLVRDILIVWKKSSEKVESEMRKTRDACARVADAQEKALDKPGIAEFAGGVMAEMEDLAKRWMEIVLTSLTSLEDRVEESLKNLDKIVDQALVDALIVEEANAEDSVEKRQSRSLIFALEDELAKCSHPFVRRMLEVALMKAREEWKERRGGSFQRHVERAGKAKEELAATEKDFDEEFKVIEKSYGELKRTFLDLERKSLLAWKDSFEGALQEANVIASGMRTELGVGRADDETDSMASGALRSGPVMSFHVLLNDGSPPPAKEEDLEEVKVQVRSFEDPIALTFVPSAATYALFFSSPPSLKVLRLAAKLARESGQAGIAVPKAVLSQVSGKGHALLLAKEGKPMLLEKYIRRVTLGASNLFQQLGASARTLGYLKGLYLDRLCMQELTTLTDVVDAYVAANHAKLGVLPMSEKHVIVVTEKSFSRPQLIPVHKLAKAKCYPIDIARMVLKVWRKGEKSTKGEQVPDIEQVSDEDIEKVAAKLTSVQLQTQTLAGSLTSFLSFCLHHKHELSQAETAAKQLRYLCRWASKGGQLKEDSFASTSSQALAGGFKPRFFVSCADREEGVGRKLAMLTEEGGDRAYCPPSDLEYDCANLAEKRVSMAAVCDVLIVVLSPAWLASPLCEKDLATFMNKGNGHLVGSEGVVFVLMENPPSADTRALLQKHSDRPQWKYPFECDGGFLRGWTEGEESDSAAKLLASIRECDASIRKVRKKVAKSKFLVGLKIEEDTLPSPRSAPSTPRVSTAASFYVPYANLPHTTGALDDTESSLTVPAMTVTPDERVRRRDARKSMEADLLRYSSSSRSRPTQYSTVYNSPDHHRLYFVHDDHVREQLASRGSSKLGSTGRSSWGISSRLFMSTAKSAESNKSRGLRSAATSIATVSSSSPSRRKLRTSPSKKRGDVTKDHDDYRYVDQVPSSPFSPVSKIICSPTMVRPRGTSNAVGGEERTGAPSPASPRFLPALTGGEYREDQQGLAHFDSWRKVVHFP